MGVETADDIKFPHEAIDSDPIGSLLLPAAAAYGGLEALGSDAVASIAAQARAALASAMAAVGNLGTTAADKAQELYESMENAINNWLQDNDSFSPERNNASSLISSTTQASPSRTLPDRIIDPMQPFADNDLVYGPSANGSLRNLSNQYGGMLLTDYDGPKDGNWIKYSENFLNDAAQTGRQVHFDLTNMDDINSVLANQGPYANTITGAELRYIMNNWGNFMVKPKFYNDGWEVLAPWIK